jgi:hypothetical protein
MARRDLFEFYLRLPSHHIWLYLKRIRFMLLYGSEIGIWNEIEDCELCLEDLFGFEDVIAQSEISKLR